MVRQGFTKVALALFILCLIWTMFFVEFSIMEYNDDGVEDYYTESGTHVVVHNDTDFRVMSLFICSPGFIILTLCLLAYWLHRKKWDKLADDLPSYINMYRRMELERIATRMNITMKELDLVMKMCLREGTVRGNVDPITHEFVSLGSGDTVGMKNSDCPNCGAPVDTPYLAGEVIKCSYCGFLIGTQGTKS